MRKVLLSIAAIFFITNIANASSEDATLTDIKESLYYLIKDYQTLSNKVTVSTGDIKTLQNKSNKLTKKTEEIKKLKKEIASLKNKFTFSKETDTPEDKIIDDFIEKNSDKYGATK